jgi:hypothetical protein
MIPLMTDSPNRTDVLERRIAALERSSRRWKFIGTLLSVAILVAAAPQERRADVAKDATFDSVKARSFTVIGENGDVQAELRDLGGRTGIFRLYAKGSQDPFFQVATTKDGYSSLVLQPPGGAKGTTGLSVIVDDKTGASAILYAANGHPAVIMNPENRRELGTINAVDGNGALLWKSP